MPRLEDGALADNYPLDHARLRRWRGADIGVRGQPDWVFIKLYCHGFFPLDPPTAIGEPIRRFLEEVLEYGERTGETSKVREVLGLAALVCLLRRGGGGAFRARRGNGWGGAGVEPRS